MIIVGNVLVSIDVTTEQFACNLAACKGACCWEGDFGAPLEADELARLEEVFPAVEPHLNAAGRAAIAEQGLFTENEQLGGHDTPLVNGRDCAYVAYTDGGMAYCTIERAYNEGKTNWKKPISCHLYPIRVNSKPEANFEALNYDRWDICSAACSKGKREKIRVYEFAKAALVRKYGEEWWNELDAAVRRETDK